MKLLEALRHAGRFSVTPTFSLFGTSSTGEYTLLLNVNQAEKIVKRFKEECLKNETCGLEVRCNGMRVDFDGT